MPLSAQAIKEYIEAKLIFVDPYVPEHAKGASLDVCLGEFYFKMNKEEKIRNLYSPRSGVELWGDARAAQPLRELTKELNILLRASVHPDELIIMVDPFGTILTHTHEFIGSTKRFVGDIRGRSTIRRNGLTVSADGNWGDPGFIGRWTLYIENRTPHSIPLVVGRRVAQVVFHEVVGDAKEYASEAEGGKYQLFASVEAMKANWRPEHILPKMHKDREMSRGLELFI